MKWFRNKEMLQDILVRNKNELTKYKHDKIVALLKDESNLIQDHLILLDENEKLNKVIEILKRFNFTITETRHNNTCFEIYTDSLLEYEELTQQEYELLKEVLEGMSNKYQEALNKVRKIYVESEHYDEEDITLLQELIDKETPKKHVKWECAKPETRCQKCGAGIERKHDYCWGCGQKLDWSNKDE